MAHNALDTSQNDITHGGANLDKALFLILIKERKKKGCEFLYLRESIFPIFVLEASK